MAEYGPAGDLAGQDPTVADPERRDAEERLAAAVRRLVEHSVSVDAPTAELHDAAAALEAVADRLDAHPRGPGKQPRLPDLDDLQAHFFPDPVVGTRNPIAPPWMIEIDGTTVRGRANLGRAYEGPPGFVHGAVIAAAFDLLLGLANIVGGSPGFTGTLTIRYRRPTPLMRDLVMECAVERVEGRKAFVRGTLSCGDETTAEAEGIFISVGIPAAKRYWNVER